MDLSGQLTNERNSSEEKENDLQKELLKNGRIFGLRRANLCYKLNNEKITITKN